MPSQLERVASGDVTRDGQRLLVMKLPLETASRRVTVVVNWLEELKAKAP